MVKEEETKSEPIVEDQTNGQEFAYELKVPQERVAVLIGEKGEIKKEIESQTKTKLDISSEGDITITGNDALLLFTSQQIVKAIARGFNPKIALLLTKTDYVLEMIDLKDASGKSKNTMIRLKGRIIGKEGRSREEIERLTNTDISVYGKTIAIIGETMDVFNARQALSMLLQGAMHKTVYRFLEKQKKKMLMG
ncbi:pre-rRNA-processing protein PNO1 [Nanoarchaeota archaeon]